jgi:hypothetical protein
MPLLSEEVEGVILQFADTDLEWIRRSLEVDNFAAPVRILEDGEADEFRGEFDALIAREGGRGIADSGFNLHDRHFDLDFVWELVTSDRVLRIVRAVLGDDIALLGTSFICKWPDDERIVPWHQDGVNSGLEPPIEVNLWYAVDQADLENGCMLMIPGSGRDGMRRHRVPRPRRVEFTQGQELDIAQDDALRIVPATLRAGESIVFDGATIHGSVGNISRRRRCGLAIRYVPASVRLLWPGKWPAVMVSGTDRYGNIGDLTRETYASFEYRPMPKDLEPALPKV